MTGFWRQVRDGITRSGPRFTAEELVQELADSGIRVPAKPCARWSREQEHDPHLWMTPAEGIGHCPGLPPLPRVYCAGCGGPPHAVGVRCPMGEEPWVDRMREELSLAYAARARNRRARAFNAVAPVLRERGHWLPLNAREAVADAVLAAADGPTAPAANVPASTAEQLPAHLLALIDIDLPPYTSSACQTAALLEVTTSKAKAIGYADDLRQVAVRLHARCRFNHKFTGTLCGCGCHPAPAAIRDESKERHAD